MAQSFTRTVTVVPAPGPEWDEKYSLDKLVYLDGDAALTAQALSIVTAGSPAPSKELDETFEPGAGEETFLEITVRAVKRTKSTAAAELLALLEDDENNQIDAGDTFHLLLTVKNTAQRPAESLSVDLAGDPDDLFDFVGSITGVSADANYTVTGPVAPGPEALPDLVEGGAETIYYFLVTCAAGGPGSLPDSGGTITIAVDSGELVLTGGVSGNQAVLEDGSGSVVLDVV